MLNILFNLLMTPLLFLSAHILQQQTTPSKLSTKY